MRWIDVLKNKDVQCIFVLVRDAPDVLKCIIQCRGQETLIWMFPSTGNFTLSFINTCMIELHVLEF